MTCSRLIFNLAALCLAILSASERSCQAWDAVGHEIIASLALDRLNPKARLAVTALARQVPSPECVYTPITLSCWMDDLKRNDLALPEHGQFYPWHYIDLGVEPGDPVPSFQPGNDNEFDGNVVQALKRAEVVLQGGTDPYIKSQAMACALALHLVGDIHQPLHAATHYFTTAGGWLHHDAGGNKEYLLNGPPNEHRFSLHAFWDSAWRASFDGFSGNVILDERFHERRGHDESPVREEAREISASIPSSRADLEPHFEQWAQESNQIAQSFVYREITATESKNHCRLSGGYVARARLIARQRLVLASERLAFLLNETLGAAAPSTPPPPYPPGPPGHPYGPGY